MAAFITACNSSFYSGNPFNNDHGTALVDNKAETNKKVIADCKEAFAKQDIDVMFKDAAPVFIDYGDGTTPTIGHIVGTKVFIKMLQNSFDNSRDTNVQLIADGDCVFHFADWSGIFKNDLMGLKAAGKPVRYKDCDIFKFDAKSEIIEHRSVQNIGALLMAANSLNKLSTVM